MHSWRVMREPSLDELLGDEIMERMIRRSGLDTAEFRRQLAELARRLDFAPKRLCASGCGVGFR